MEIKYIIVHSSATKASMDIGANEIDQWHREKGWRGIGYHLVIRRSGLIDKGRELNKYGAHTYGFNKVSWGICMVGGLDSAGVPEDNYTKEQKETLAELLSVMHKMEPKAEIKGHRDMSPDINGDGIISKGEWLKACPCFDITDFLLDYEVTQKKLVKWGIKW